MTSLVRQFDARPTVLALALFAAYGPTFAQSAETKAPAGDAAAPPAPASDTGVVSEGSVSVGVDGISGNSADRAQFGQYNGLRNVGKAAGILGFDYARRDAEAGTSLLVTGSNLLLETREVGLAWKAQGNWKLVADYNEQVHYDPYTVNTGLIGFGTAAPQVVPLPGGPGSGSDMDLKVNRTSLGVGFWKAITPAVSFEASLRARTATARACSATGSPAHRRWLRDAWAPPPATRGRPC